VYGFTPAALDALRKAPWPGNVRELINRIRRAVVVADGPRIEPADLGLEATGGEEPGLRLREARSRAEVTAVLAALRRSGWNKSEAARRLDISRTQLYEILHRHHISNEG
jgi:DNA-binding NtrC family response regulator